MTENKVVDVVDPAVKAAADAKAKADADAKIVADEAAKAAAAGGKKVGELFESKEEKTVPESVFLEQKKELGGMWKEVKKLQDMVADGLSKKEVSETLKKIGEKYKVDPNFLDEVSKAIKAEDAAEIDKKIDAKVKPLEEKEKSEKATTETERIDKIFKDNFAKTINAMPDFKDLADAEYVKFLTLKPENRDKTFADILEKAYGHLVKGKGKTIETTKPGGGKDATVIDYDKATKDPDYFKQIMGDPAQRKEYNANLHKRLKL